MTFDPRLIPGPDSSIEPVRKSGLVARVYDRAKLPDVKAEARRLRTALLADDRDAIVKAARLLTSEQRLEVLTEVDAIRKGAAMPADPSRAVGWTAGFRVPRPTFGWDPVKRTYSVANPRPAQTTEPAAPVNPRLQIAPQTGSGFLHEIRRGAIVHFDLEGTRHHAKVLRWGKVGATVVTATGDIAAVTWEDLKFGVAPESAVEHVAKSLSGAMPLWAMSPEERARYFALRDPDFEKTEPADEPPAATPKPPRRWLRLS